jgi:hypothetical protein
MFHKYKPEDTSKIMRDTIDMDDYVNAYEELSK